MNYVRKEKKVKAVKYNGSNTIQTCEFIVDYFPDGSLALCPSSSVIKITVEKYFGVGSGNVLTLPIGCYAFVDESGGFGVCEASVFEKDYDICTPPVPTPDVDTYSRLISGDLGYLQWTGENYMELVSLLGKCNVRLIETNKNALILNNIEGGERVITKNQFIVWDFRARHRGYYLCSAALFKILGDME